MRKLLFCTPYFFCFAGSQTAAAGHANRQNSLRMSIGNQRISGLAPQTDSVV